MLVRVPDNINCLGRKILIDQIENRRLVKFCEEHNFDLSRDHKTLYCLAVGRTKLCYSLIFKLRNIIPPLYWFLPPDTDPSTVKVTNFTSMYSEPDYGKETVAHIIMHRILDEHRIGELITNTGLKRQFINQIRYKKLQDGKEIYRVRPSEKMVIGMKDYIKEDLWYIYPEEVDPDELKMIYITSK